VDTIEQATAALRAGRGADLLMVDARLDIAALIAANEAEHIVVPVVAAGVGIDPALAAKAIRAGAREYISLPPEPELIAAVLAAISDDERPLIAEDASMKQVIALADQIAQSEASIMITGESGVGKELLARAIQGASERAGRPFVTVNCGAIPENLVESILFGHAKGSFTGATDNHAGKFVEANGGTLFLDEVGELPLDMQVKLLRVLQEGEVERLGSARTIKVDVRVIAATNIDPVEAVKAGKLREDLYYRLNVFAFRLPTLRERKEDLPLLVRNFMKRIQTDQGVARELDESALATLTNHDWPGNVRELRNIVERLVIFCDTHITEEDVQSALPGVKQVRGSYRRGAALKDLVASAEREIVLAALDANQHHIANTARELGLERSHLYKKMRALGIDHRADEEGGA
jgi:DNA-binding NtrC family response regulator